MFRRKLCKILSPDTGYGISYYAVPQKIHIPQAQWRSPTHTVTATFSLQNLRPPFTRRQILQRFNCDRRLAEGDHELEANRRNKTAKR